MDYKFKLWSFLIFILGIFCAKVSYSNEETIHELDSKLIPYVEALNVVNNLGSAQNSSFYKTSQAIATSIKKHGILVDSFIVDSRYLTKISLPFMVYLQNRGWRIVSKIDLNIGVVAIVNAKGVEEVLKQSEFLSLWQGQVVSEVITNVPVYKIPVNPEQLQSNNRIVIIYLNHDRFRNFNQIKIFLDSFIKNTESVINSSQNIVYIDELGLIPEDTVNNRAKSMGISRKKAFEQLKAMFQKELWRIKKGYSLYDPADFYRNLYKYMAKSYISCYIENLDYKLWEFIVSFDDLKVFTLARYYFISGDFSKALHTLRTYQEGYSTYNIKIRDENFIAQIESIRQKHPKVIIFTVRGLAHYGIENTLVNKGENVQVLIAGNDNFLKNFSLQQRVFLLKRNGVTLDQAKENILLMKTFPQETLRGYFDEYNKNIDLTTKVTLDIVERLNMDDLQNLAKAWRGYFIDKGYKNRDYSKFSEFTFNWFKDQGFIKKEELGTIQN